MLSGRGYLVAGLGFGIFNPLRAENIVDLVPDEHAGIASGIGNTFRELGVGCGVALMGSVFLQSMSDELGVDFQSGLAGDARTQSGENVDQGFSTRPSG